MSTPSPFGLIAAVIRDEEPWESDAALRKSFQQDQRSASGSASGLSIAGERPVPAAGRSVVRSSVGASVSPAPPARLDPDEGMSAWVLDDAAREIAFLLGMPPERAKLMRKLFARAVRQALEPEALRIESHGGEAPQLEEYDVTKPGLARK